MKAHDFRNLSRDELIARIDALQHEYFSAKETVRSGKEKNHATLKQLRRDVARAKTVLRQLA